MGKIKNYNSLIFLLCFMNLFEAKSEMKPNKLKVLIVDGFSNHDWKQTTFVVKSILEKSGLFIIDCSTAPVIGDSIVDDSWNPAFQKYDVVIQNTNNINNKRLRWPKVVENNLGDFVRSGGGLYILHSANNAFLHWEAYNFMIGLGWRSKDEYLALRVGENKGLIEIPKHEGKSTTHGARTNQVIYKLSEHPINKGFPKKWKTPDMELYEYPRGPAKNLTVLSYAKHDATNMYWPVEWVINYGKGKVYNSSMGHLWKGDTYPEGYRCIGFQTTLIRATEWLASSKTTYPIPDNFPSEEEIVMVSLETLIKTD